jgi:hypothetical protein
VPVVAQISVELAVVGISRIAAVGTPDLPARFQVPAKRNKSFWSLHGSVDSCRRPRIAKQQPVGIERQIRKATLSNQRLQAGLVATFGEPESTRRFPEVVFTCLTCDHELRPPRLFVGDKRQKCMGRWASDDFDQASSCSWRKALRVAAVLLETLSAAPKSCRYINANG